VEFEADCSRCFGLCCVALAFGASADFAFDKPSGEPCLHLQQDFRCGIHSELRQRGFPGCTVFDCLGAGQHVSQAIYGGEDWRSKPETASQMFEVFARVRELHMLLWHLREALQLSVAQPLHAEVERAFAHLETVRNGTPEALVALDVAAETRAARDLLRRVSELARSAAPKPRKDFANQDLIGAKLTGANLQGANLRGAQLIAADMRGADLRLADLTAADLRNADLGGADLSHALFVRQSQLEAARGDAATRLPPARSRPAHWLR
jgi:pentapeptide repeat protein